MCSLKKRNHIVFIFYICIFLLLIYRIVTIQYVNSEKLTSIANSQYRIERNISELNYLILDSTGKDLMKYKNRFIVEIDPYIFKRYNSNTPLDKIFALTYILRSYSRDYDITNVISSTVSEKIKWNVDEETFNKLMEIKNVNGIYLYIYSETDKSEAWKIQNIISNLDNLDSTNTSANLILKTLKKNKPTNIVFERDEDGNIKNKNYTIPEKNVNLRLTLDQDLQEKVNNILNEEKYKLLSEIGVVILESDTGKIKVLTQRDHKNPNIILGSGTANGYVPGSIFKLLVETAALDTKKVSLNEKFLCEVHKDSLCKEPHGNITIEEALKVSCNNVFAQVGKKVGWDNILSYAKAEGLFDKVLNFKGDKEVKGEYREPAIYEDGPRFLSMGQNMLISPLQAINIVNTIVNGGTYVKPYITDALVDINNKEVKVFNTEKKQIMKKTTASTMKDQMIKVVNEGTGKNASIPGVEIGGKTGTTERIDYTKDTDGKEKREKHSDGWFIGFFKIKDKYYSMVIFVKDIDAQGMYGGNTAAPIFKDIVTILLKK